MSRSGVLPRFALFFSEAGTDSWAMVGLDNDEDVLVKRLREWQDTRAGILVFADLFEGTCRHIDPYTDTASRKEGGT